MSRRAYPDSSIHPSDDADRARHTSSAYCGRQSLGLESDDQWGYEELKHCPGLRPLPRILSARIPFEVMETIIDSGEETSLLCACALVCRSWNRYSTKKLYRSITITSRTELERLSASARQFPEVRERLTETLCIVLRNSAQAFPLILGRYLLFLRPVTAGQCHCTNSIRPRAVRLLRASKHTIEVSSTYESINLLHHFQTLSCGLGPNTARCGTGGSVAWASSSCSAAKPSTN